MSVSTLTSASLTIPYMPMTIPIIDCGPPILESDFDHCRIPGGVEFWSSNGFYSPGQCFVGYQAECTQTRVRDDAWPIDEGETAVMCIPTGYDCNERNGNPRYATTAYDGTTLSAPAFEIRWRSEDLQTGGMDVPWPTLGTQTSQASIPITLGTWESSSTQTPTSTPSPTPATRQSQSSEWPVPPSPPPAETPSSALTTGSIAGIAVGTSFGTLVTVLIIIYLTMRRRRRASKSAPSSDSNDQQAPSYAVSPNQPPVELHPESMGPRELESAPVSPDSNNFPVSPTSTLGGVDRNVVSLNTVPIEMAGDETFTKSTGVEEAKGEMSGTTREESSASGDVDLGKQ